MDTCVLSVKVTPGASKNAIQGWLGESLKVRIQAPPTDGRANDALCAFLAQSLALPRHAVTLYRGAASRQKQVTITGLNADQARERLRGI